MRQGGAMLMLALLGGCTSAASEAVADREADGMAVAENAVGEGDLPWSYVQPIRRFAADSTARNLLVPPELRGAKLGYFDDPPIVAQYSARQLAQMRRDEAGFVTTLDRDHNGSPETYRTGYWERGGDSGTFLVVFEKGVQKGFADTHDGGLFLSWHGGRLVLAACNCEDTGEVKFAHDELNVRFRPE